MSKEIIERAVANCEPYDDKWLKELIDNMNNLEFPDPQPELLNFCNVLNGDPVTGFGGTSNDILKYFERETDALIRANPRLSAQDASTLKLQGITAAMDYAMKFETERVNIANKNNETALALLIQKMNAYSTMADLRMKLELFIVERDIAYAKLLSMKADWLLKRTQAISFVFNQRAKLTDMLFNTVIVGVTQELMHVMADPNNVFGGLSPRQKFEEAWMDNEYLKDLNELEWEGLCSPKDCNCAICKG